MPNEQASPSRHAYDEGYELVGRVAGGVAHDLNNALSTVTTFADLLLARCEPGSSTAEDLAEIKEAGMAAAAVLRRLWLFARPGRHPPEVLDVAEVLRSMEPLLARLLGSCFTLRVSADAPAPPVLAPTARIEELLLALAGAARRSAPEGGAVALVAGPDRPTDGTGNAYATIEMSTSAEMAAPAETSTPSVSDGRAEATPWPEPLALVRALVGELEGRIEVLPDAEGGTLVRVTLRGEEPE